MEQENSKDLNKISTPKKKLSNVNNDLDTPIKSSNSKKTLNGSSSRRRTKKNNENNNFNINNITIETPEIGTPGGTPYILRSKKKEVTSTGSSIRKKNLVMPPLNLENKVINEKSEFFDREVSNNINSDFLVYSTPRKRNRELNVGEDENKSSQIKSLSKRRSNTKSTPVTINNRKNPDEDSAIKDRKSILKQYDPDNVNTANIKTPKSHKKVQFGVKNLIIINENKQNDNVDKLVVENDVSVDNSSEKNNLSNRISILSELDDTNTGPIYNFPSLEELIKSDEKNENFHDPSISLSTMNGDKITQSNNFNISTELDNVNNDNSNIDDNIKDVNYVDKNKINQKDDQICNGDDKLSFVDKDTNIQNNGLDNSIDITDQMNISDYSINCRDSITPNVPGAFLSVVMKNLSSVSFVENESDKVEKKSVIEDNSKYTNDFDEREVNEDKEVIDDEKVNSFHKSDISEKINLNENVNNSELTENATNRSEINYNIEKKENLSDFFEIKQTNHSSELQESNELILNKEKDLTIIDQNEIVTKIDFEKNNDTSQFSDPTFPKQELDCLKNDDNLKLNISITPMKNYSDSRNDKLSPSSRSLLDFLKNTKSILNITPQGYTWEEFQSLLNLNYKMDNFDILDFEEFDNDSKNNNQMIKQIEEIIKKSEVDCNDKTVIFEYIEKLIKSLKTQVWEEIENSKLIQLYTEEIYEEKYKKNLLKFPDSEIATTSAIIVNKSRYGSKIDEKIKNELLSRISTYFLEDNVFSKSSWIGWKEQIIFPYKNLLIQKYENQIKKTLDIQESIINNKNRIKNSFVLLSTIESCQMSEMHVYETYWNAMKIVHENINSYKKEISRMKNYINTMINKKNNLNRLINKEEELSNTLILELNHWKSKKSSLKNNLNNLRIKEAFAGFTWDLFTTNKFQTLVVLNSNNCDYIKTRISIEWNIDQNRNINDQDNEKAKVPITLSIELDESSINEVLVKDFNEKINENNLCNHKIENKIYQGYIDIISKTLNLRLTELYNNYKNQGKMNENILIELIRGIFQSSIILLWRLESIIFEILNVTKVFNLAILDINGNELIMNIPVLIGLNCHEDIENQKIFPSNPSSSPLLLSASSPLTPNSISNLSPHLLMSSRPIISITFNITNSLFKSVGTLVNSIQNVLVYNTSDEISQDMVRVFNEQIKEINENVNKNSAVYVGYNCLLSIIQNAIQEGGHNQLIWKRPLERFAPRLLNAVQISKLHQNY